MRATAGFFVFCALAGQACGQNRKQLDAAFGHADQYGKWQASDALMTVRFGEDGSACRVDLHARSGQYFLPSTAAWVLSEIVPEKVRLGAPKTTKERMACAAKESSQWNNVAISRTTDECFASGKPNLQSVAVVWKRPECIEKVHQL